MLKRPSAWLRELDTMSVPSKIQREVAPSAHGRQGGPPGVARLLDTALRWRLGAIPLVLRAGATEVAAARRSGELLYGFGLQHSRPVFLCAHGLTSSGGSGSRCTIPTTDLWRHTIGDTFALMTQTDWPSKVTARVADALRARREELGLTAQDVADACSVLGYPIPRSVIANLENGRRASVGLAEILILAEVLGVPPITMLFPLGTAPTIEVLPGREVSMWDAVAWVTGESREEAMKAPAQTVLNMFREHGILVSVALLSRRMGEEKRREAALASDPEHRARFLGMVAEFDRIHARDIQALRDWRARMREQEVVPPALPDDFAYLESSESAQ